MSNTKGRITIRVPGDPLATRALHIVTTNLSKFGNELSSDHIGELRTLLRGMSELARGKRNGRYAYALDCRLGKTQAVIALCTAIHQLGKAHLSVAISASQVEALCQVKRDLIDNGVPEEEIGLVHSYRFDPEKIGQEEYASLPATENNDQRRFQLVTHARVKGGRASLDQYARYKGKRRSLLVYDESLFISEPSVLNALELEQQWGWIKPKLERRRRDDPTSQRAHHFLEIAVETIKAELERQQRCHSRAQPIELEPLSIDDIRAFKNTLGHNKNVDALKRLLEMSQERLRAVYTTHKNGDGLVTYDISDLACWLGRRRITPLQLTAEHLGHYLEYRSRQRRRRSGDAAIVRRLFSLLLEKGIVAQRPPIEITPAQRLEEEFRRYLEVARRFPTSP